MSGAVEAAAIVVVPIIAMDAATAKLAKLLAFVMAYIIGPAAKTHDNPAVYIIRRAMVDIPCCFWGGRELGLFDINTS